MPQVMLLGDSHGDQGFISRAYKQVVAADRDGTDISAVISVGDFGIWPGRSGTAFLDHVEYWAARTGVPMLVVPGNHDDYDQLDAAEPDDDGWLRLRDHVRAAPRGLVFTLGAATFLACGGAASPDGPGGPFVQARGPYRGTRRIYDRQTNRVTLKEVDQDLGGWWPQEIVTDADVAACRTAIEQVHAAGGRIHVLVTHEAPAELNMGGADFPAGQQVRDRIQQVLNAARPDLAVAGHWHCAKVATLTHDPDAYGVVLSANTNPDHPQWLLYDLDTGELTIARPGRAADRL